MATQNFYMPGKAAELLKISEDEVVQLIKSGKIKAEFLHNIGNYMIPHMSIMDYLKRTRKTLDSAAGVMNTRILLVDRDPDFQDLVKMDLERRDGVEVKIATSERDVQIQVEEFQPHIILIHLAATLRSSDRIGKSVRQARIDNGAYVIVYHNHAPDVAKENQDIRAQLKASGANEAVSIFAGARTLLQAVTKRVSG